MLILYISLVLIEIFENLFQILKVKLSHFISSLGQTFSAIVEMEMCKRKMKRSKVAVTFNKAER